MASPSRSFASSSSNLALPQGTTTRQQRRMTSPALPPPNPLGLPEPVFGMQGHRPASPLCREVSDQEEEEDDHRPHSPSPSFGRYAANFARSVGSLMSPSKSTSTLLSDAELEAEAEIAREHSRREAERILQREARERRHLEERVMAMVHDEEEDEHGTPMRPPPSRSQTFPSTPPNGSPVRENGGRWWSSAKAKLTPTKDLTPAQEIIRDSKQRDKDRRKAEKAVEKAEKKAREQQWPAKPSSKYVDPAFAALAGSQRPDPPSQRTQPTPLQTQGPLTPPRARRFSTPASLTSSPAGAAGSSKENPPLYAHFDEEGTLDVHGTLLVVAKRFEKLEKWTVGHVRALEERMSDVEKWLVDKEREREEDKTQANREREEITRAIARATANAAMAASSASGGGGGGGGEEVAAELEAMRDEMAELQGRIGELGREMAKLAASGTSSSRPSVQRAPSTSNNIIASVHRTPSNGNNTASVHRTPSNGNNTASVHRTPSNGNAASVHRAPSTSNATFSLPGIPTNVSRTPSAMYPPPQPVSPPSVGAPSSRTRLPYPTGDYAFPQGSGGAGSYTPASSPPPISGLPRSSSPFNVPVSEHGTGNSMSALPPPAAPALRQQARHGSVSPTPRKRYTVALGGPIRSPSQESLGGHSPTSTPARGHSRSSSRIETAFFVESSGPAAGGRSETEDSEREPVSESDGVDSEVEQGEETIGKAASRRRVPPGSAPAEPTSDFRERRSRAQSAYSFGAIPGSADRGALDSPGTAPLRMRAHSTDRFGSMPQGSQSSPSLVSSLGLGIMNLGSSAGSVAGSDSPRFVDPLLVRRATREREMNVGPPAPKVMAGKKVPVGQLVAFFDNSKTKR